MNKIRLFVTLLLGCVAAITLPARAVSTSHWTQANEADFSDGTLHNVVVTNLGDVKLSHAVQVIQQEDPNVTTVNCLAATPDGTIYAGTGPKGELLAVKDDKVSTVATLDDTINILCLLVDDQGRLLIGTGGDKGKVLRIDKPGDTPKEIFSGAGVLYVWSLVETPDNLIYAATGPNGQVFQIKPDGSSSELYHSDENNITSMISDGKDLLYLGTDPDGLVIRVNRQTKESFILYNASESEVTALALDDSGNLFAATGEAGDRDQTQAPDNTEKETGGRPENNTSVTPIPSNPPQPPPQPPPMPNPNPGEPKPIPKGPQSRLIDPANLEPKMMDDDPGGDDPGGGGGGGGGGDNQPNATPDNSGAAAPHPGPRPAVPLNSGEPKPEGNAIYKIDTDGFVSEVFREDVVIYSMIARNGVLLVGTGGDGEIYQVNPAAEETVVLAKVDAKQVMCLLPVPDGRIFVGLANSGGISAMTGGYATEGTYISAVLDATQTSRFGNIQLHGQLPDGTSLKISTRSGNVRDADAAGWSSWTADVDATEYLKVTAPSARFLQYRLTFGTTAADQTPLVDHVDVAYQMPNLAPVIKSIRIGAGSDADAAAAANAAPAPAAIAPVSDKSEGTGTQTITWDASDPNNDALVYTLYFRVEPQGPWILLKDDLKDSTYDWDTRTAADGRYQVKVVASDALANSPGDGKTASRVSDSFLVDNTPPTIGDLAYKITGGEVQISFRAQDLTSPIASAEYTLDSSDNWQTVLPVDNIFDSPDESVNFSIKGLSAGTHQVTIRVTDDAGNQGLQTVILKIEGHP
ncbi:MAG: WD40 repeat domain-containing protein [Tepidisphaeraceae bacterium]|jgi:hypothetical protein